MISIPKRTWKLWARDGLVGFGFSLLFLYLTFPWDAVKQRVEVELAQGLSTPQAPAQVAIGGLHPSFTGVVLERVVLTRPDPGAGPPRSVLLPEVRLRISLLGLLRGQKDLTFGAKLFGGKVDGEILDSSKLSSLSIDA